MSTTHSSFNQYCISHKTVSHRTAAAPCPEVRRECPMTKLTALPLLATNPGDATGDDGWTLIFPDSGRRCRVSEIMAPSRNVTIHLLTYICTDILLHS